MNFGQGVGTTQSTAIIDVEITFFRKIPSNQIYNDNVFKRQICEGLTMVCPSASAPHIYILEIDCV